MTTHFKKILKQGATVVDVGANIGQFAEFVPQGQATMDELFKDLSSYGYRLSAFYPHRNYEGWLWWADGFFLPQ